MTLALALGLLVACGGKRTVAAGEGGSGSSTIPATTPETTPEPAVPQVNAVIHVTLEFEVSKVTPPTTEVTVVETDETGSNTRHKLGSFDGECKDVTPEVRSTDPDVFLGFHCQPFAQQRGVLVHLLQRQGRLVLLRAWLGNSKPSFDDFDQIGELPPTPGGVPLRTDHDT